MRAALACAGVATVIPLDELRFSATAALFEGRDELGISIFVMRYARGQGPQLHLHPYPEVFVVESGRAAFTVGDEELTVGGGNVVVVPTETQHGFASASDEPLHAVSVHPSGTVVETDL